MAHAKQEERRPGIKKIFAELQKAHPQKPSSEIATMAKLEWTRRNGPGTPAAKATQSAKAKNAAGIAA